MQDAFKLLSKAEEDALARGGQELRAEIKQGATDADALDAALNLLNHLEEQKARLERREERQQRTKLSERLADHIAEFGGSWTFIISFVVVMLTWICVNATWIVLRWDPYPFILLNLVLSTIAAIQAPVILMSQNRQAQRDRYRDQIDFERDRLDLKVDTLAAKTIHEATVRIAGIEKQLAAIHATLVTIAPKRKKKGR